MGGGPSLGGGPARGGMAVGTPPSNLLHGLMDVACTVVAYMRVEERAVSIEVLQIPEDCIDTLHLLHSRQHVACTRTHFTILCKHPAPRKT